MPVSSDLYQSVREAVLNTPIHGANGYLDMDKILQAALRQAVPLAQREYAMRVQREVAEIVDALPDDTDPQLGAKITHAILKREDDWCPDGIKINEGYEVLSSAELATAKQQGIEEDDATVERVARAIHDGPLGADDYDFDAPTPEGASARKWCKEVALTAIRALKGQP